MFEDFYTGWILPCKLSESRRWIVIYVKEYFHVAGLLYIFMHAVFKLLTYNNKSANALALCHPPSASFCSVLAVQWSSRIFTQDI